MVVFGVQGSTLCFIKLHRLSFPARRSADDKGRCTRGNLAKERGGSMTRPFQLSIGFRICCPATLDLTRGVCSNSNVPTTVGLGLPRKDSCERQTSSAHNKGTWQSWLIAPDFKSGGLLQVSWVRIPPSPPALSGFPLNSLYTPPRPDARLSTHTQQKTP